MYIFFQAICLSYVGIHSLTTWLGLFVFVNMLSGHQGSSRICSLHNHEFQSLPTYGLLWKGRDHSTLESGRLRFQLLLLLLLIIIIVTAQILIYFVNISTYLILSMPTDQAGCWVLCSSRFEATFSFVHQLDTQCQPRQQFVPCALRSACDY